MNEGGGVFFADERIPVEAALGAVTFDAAWQCHMDNIVGSLEPGPLCNQTADPTLLVPVYYLTPIRM
jgi:predicted amidohydrolase YtcJ